MGGGSVPQPRSAFQEYKDTTNWLSQGSGANLPPHPGPRPKARGELEVWKREMQAYKDALANVKSQLPGAQRAYLLAEKWDPKFARLNLRDSKLNAQNASDITNQMLITNQGLTPFAASVISNMMGDNGVKLSDASYSRMTAPLASDFTQQRMANLQGLYPMIPQGSFTPMNAGQIFGAARQQSAFNQALGMQAAAQQAAMTNGLIDAGFGAAGTGLGYGLANMGGGSQTYRQAFGGNYVGDIPTSVNPVQYYQNPGDMIT